MALTAARRGPVRVLVRPEAVGIVRDPAGDAVVELAEYHGPDSRYAVRAADGTTVRVRSGDLPDLARGDRVALHHAGAPTVAFAAGAVAPVD